MLIWPFSNYTPLTTFGIKHPFEIVDSCHTHVNRGLCAPSLISALHTSAQGSQSIECQVIHDLSSNSHFIFHLKKYESLFSMRLICILLLDCWTHLSNESNVNSLGGSHCELIDMINWSIVTHGQQSM